MTKRQPSNVPHVLLFIGGSIFACLLVAFIGSFQTQDEVDAQTAAGQIMACSDHPKECQAFERSRK